MDRRNEERVLARGVYQCVKTFDNQVVLGLGINISDSGVGMYTSENLEPGLKLIVSCEGYWENRKRTGEVTWIRHIVDDLYRIGIALNGS